MTSMSQVCRDLIDFRAMQETRCRREWTYLFHQVTSAYSVVHLQFFRFLTVGMSFESF